MTPRDRKPLDAESRKKRKGAGARKPAARSRRARAGVATAAGTDAGAPPETQSAPATLELPHPSAALAAITAAASEAVRVVAAAEPARSLRERAKARTGTADLLLFRVGHELFATDLAAIEEAMELPEVHRLPEMPGTLLGMFSLRGHMTPVYSPARALGVPLASAAAASLVVRARDRRIALAVDDVEDVLRLDLATLREPPSLAEDAVLLGVARRGTDLVALVDADALVAACLTDRVTDRDGDPLATRATESV